MSGRRGTGWALLAAGLVLACGQESPDAASGALQASEADGDAPPVEMPAGLNPDEGVEFALASEGDVVFSHTGGALCQVYQGELMVSFLQVDDPFLGYELRVPNLDGSGNYDGSFEVGRGDVGSSGPASVDLTLGGGHLTGRLTADATGQLGDAAVSGSFTCEPDGLGGAEGTAATGSGTAWIDYQVTGEAEASLREEDVMICSRGDDGGLMARSLGAWVVDIETDWPGPGEGPASFTVAAPSHVDALSGSGADPRLRGAGTLVLEDGGSGPMGMPSVQARFQASDLVSDLDHRIGISGSFRCPVM